MSTVAPQTNGTKSSRKIVESAKVEETKTEETAKPKLTAEEKAALFDAVIAAQKARDESDEKHKRAVSEASKKLVDAIGTGPFRYKGEVIRMGHRKDLWFMKRPGSLEVEDI